jgi:hypothetical protein
MIRELDKRDKQKVNHQEIKLNVLDFDHGVAA